MSANAIMFDTATGQFRFDNEFVSPSELGRDLVESLLDNEQVTSFGVTPEYVYEMLRITGATGRFYDCLSDTADHRFNPGHPTVGGNWGEVQRLQGQARTVEYIVKRACSPVVGYAAALIAQADNMRLQADELDVRSLDTADGELGDKLAQAAEELRREAGLIRRSARRMQRNMANRVSNGAQVTAAAMLRQSASELDAAVPAGNCPLSDAFTLPTVKCADPRYGSDAVWYDAKADVFCFGGYRIGQNKLGRLLAAALLRGDSNVTIGGITVGVRVLFEMAREAGQSGQFGFIVD